MLATLPWGWDVIILLIVWAAAVRDIRTLTIPHIFPIILMLLWVPAAAISIRAGVTLDTLAWLAIGGAVAFVVGLVMYLFRIMGAGDVKLVAALAPFIAFRDLHILFACIGIGGLVWTLAFAAREALRARSVKAVRRKKMPYGPAIALGLSAYIALPLLLA